MDKIISFNYTMNKEDLIKFHANHILKCKSFKKANICYLALCWFFICTLIYIFPKNFGSIVSILILILTTLFSHKVFIIKFKRKLKKIYSSEEKSYMFKPTEINICKTGISVYIDSIEKIYTWNDINFIHMIDDYLIISLYKKKYLYILCEDESEFDKEQFNKFINTETNKFICHCYPESLKYN